MGVPPWAPDRSRHSVGSRHHWVDVVATGGRRRHSVEGLFHGLHGSRHEAPTERRLVQLCLPCA